MGIKIGKWDPVKSAGNAFGLGGVSGIGKEIKNFGFSNNPLFSQAGALQRSILGKEPKAPGSGEDPNVAALRGRLFGEAQDFEKGLGGMQKSASDQIGKEGDMALEKGLTGNRRNYNRRGLLFSGLREGGDQDVRGRVASTMAGQKAQSNKELSDMAKSKWNTVAQVGLQGYQDSVNREAEIAGISLQNQVARAQSMQQLGQVGGQATGYFYGGGGQQSTPNTGTGGYSSSYTPYGNQPRAVS